MFGHDHAVPAHRHLGRGAARARRRRRRHLRRRARRLVLRLDLPAHGWPARDGPDDLLRDRDGPLARRRVPLRRVDVDLADRLGAAGPVVHHPGVLQLLRLRHHDGRRDQPAALRPRRGRGRAHRWLPHRVRLDALRDVLPRRVHQHVHRRRPRHDDVPRRLAGASRHRGDQRRDVQRGLVGPALVHRQAVDVHVRVRLAARLAAAGALRPVHALRLEVPHPRHARLGRARRVLPRRPERLARTGSATSTFAGRTFPGSSLLLVGVIAVLALVLGWMWDRRAEAKEAAAHPTVPEEIDPYAGGYPVPPLPGPAPARALARRTRP